jgi:hypothetical protein
MRLPGFEPPGDNREQPLGQRVTKLRVLLTGLAKFTPVEGKRDYIRQCARLRMLALPVEHRGPPEGLACAQYLNVPLPRGAGRLQLH